MPAAHPRSRGENATLLSQDAVADAAVSNGVVALATANGAWCFREGGRDARVLLEAREPARSAVAFAEDGPGPGAEPMAVGAA